MVLLPDDPAFVAGHHCGCPDPNIFLLSVFAEILVTTNGGPGTASTNLTYLVYNLSLLQFDVGGGSAGGIVAVILANIVAFFWMRAVGKNLET
ncbi:MAG: sorbitol/mannitol transport system permease protein [Paracoccaceae bacterium]|jgi:sorbitol/mannitol transport system permease protein